MTARHRYSLFALLGIATILAGGLFFIQGRTTKNPQAFINGKGIVLDVVTTPQYQALGLARYEYLPADHGMLFLYRDKAPRVFWMKDMKFPIDIVWLDTDVVVGVVENVPIENSVPDDQLTRYSSPQSVNRVLELNAGTIKDLNLKIGDSITFNL